MWEGPAICGQFHPWAHDPWLQEKESCMSHWEKVSKKYSSMDPYSAPNPRFLPWIAPPLISLNDVYSTTWNNHFPPQVALRGPGVYSQEQKANEDWDTTVVRTSYDYFHYTQLLLIITFINLLLSFYNFIHYKIILCNIFYILNILSIIQYDICNILYSLSIIQYILATLTISVPLHLLSSSPNLLLLPISRPTFMYLCFQFLHHGQFGLNRTTSVDISI